MAIRKEGAFFEIVLPNGKFSYGRILPKACYAFYDVYSDEPIADIKSIQANSVLFIVAVYKFAISKGRWKKIGSSELEANLKLLPFQFIFNAFVGVIINKGRNRN